MGPPFGLGRRRALIASAKRSSHLTLTYWIAQYFNAGPAL
jgi:hypothetical protein